MRKPPRTEPRPVLLGSVSWKTEMFGDFAEKNKRNFEILRIVTGKKYINNNSSIVIMSSVMADLGQPGKTAYCASKAAIIGLVNSLSLELSNRGIRVNAISPGVVRTPMTDKLFSQLDKKQIEDIVKMHPIGIGSVEDITELILYLISSKSKWITGQNIKIDGGYSVQ